VSFEPTILCGTIIARVIRIVAKVRAIFCLGENGDDLEEKRDEKDDIVAGRRDGADLAIGLRICGTVHSAWNCEYF
jgi:hypothetical protein